MPGRSAHPEMYRQLWARVEQLLGDGEWHDYECTIRELGKVIPPGIAHRKQEAERRKSGVKPRNNGEPRKIPRDVDKMIASGRRTIVRVMFKNEKFQVDKSGERARVRLVADVRRRRGGCPNSAYGHEDVEITTRRGKTYFQCRHCERVVRPSQHPEQFATG